MKLPVMSPRKLPAILVAVVLSVGSVTAIGSPALAAALPSDPPSGPTIDCDQYPQTDILALARMGYSEPDIAHMFNMSVGYINRIIDVCGNGGM
jgi:hypothetical protein